MCMRMRMRHPTHFQQERSGRSCRIRWAAPGRMRTHAQDTACPSLLRGPRRRKPARSVSHPSHRKGSAGAGRPRHARRTCPPTEATAGPAATLSWPARGRCRAWPQAARTRRAAPCSARGRAAGSHAAAARKGGQAAGRGAGHLENVQHLGHVGDVARHPLDVLRARGRCPVSAQHAVPRACALGRAGRTWLMSGRVPVARSASSSWRPPAFSSCHARPPASTSVPCRRGRGSVARNRGPATHGSMRAR